MRAQNGFSLVEALVAVSMLSLLMAGTVSVLRIALRSSERIQSGIAVQRRVSEVETDLREQIASLIPLNTQCSSAEGVPRTSIPFFEGEPDEMRFISGFSLEEKFRSSPKALEFKVIPSADSGEFRLIVNQQSWTGTSFVAPCLVTTGTGVPSIRFFPVQSYPSSFVLADKLVHCGFSYRHRRQDGGVVWKQESRPGEGFPDAVRIEISPEPGNSSLAGLANVVVPIHAKGDL